MACSATALRLMLFMLLLLIVEFLILAKVDDCDDEMNPLALLLLFMGLLLCNERLLNSA